MLLNKVQFVLPLLLIAGSQPLPVVAGELGPSPGWHYLWTLCPQEPSSSDSPALCDEGVQGMDAKAIAISSVFYMSTEYDDELETFKAEAGRRLGFQPPIVLAGPFSTLKEAKAEILVTLRAQRSAQNGLLAVTAIPMKPKRFDNEPNEDERSGEPASLPPVMESFKGGSAQLWRDEDDKACGLRLSDGSEVVPDLVTDTWGEEGKGCPSELLEGSGIYRFDVPRSGAICGETGVCTELFDSEGHWIGVIEETPYPIISVDLFRDWGIIRSGQWNERLYSIPERRHLFTRWPGDTPQEASRTIIHGATIIDNRPAIEIDLEFRDREPEIGYFWLDSMTFELATESVADMNKVQRTAVRTANRVCLAYTFPSVIDRQGHCEKALIALDKAGLSDSPVFAEVQKVLNQIQATRSAN